MSRKKTFLAALCSATFPSGLWGEELRFCYDPYPPYTLGQEGPPEGGLKVTLLHAIMDRIEGVTASVELLPWKRCQSEVREGNLDGILPLFPNEDRMSYMVFSEAALEQASSFWYFRDRFPDGVNWDGDMTQLMGLRLGMLNGSYIDSDMEASFAEGAGIVRVASVSALFLMLQHERVDLIALDSAVARHHVETNGSTERFGQVAPKISSRTSHFGLSRVTGADAHLDSFNRVIAELHAEGSIAAILAGTE